jgi:hypothetical protein
VRWEHRSIQPLPPMTGRVDASGRNRKRQQIAVHHPLDGAKVSAKSSAQARQRDCKYLAIDERHQGCEDAGSKDDAATRRDVAAQATRARSAIGRATTARLWHRLMTETLGYPKCGAQGGDIDAFVSLQLAIQNKDYVLGKKGHHRRTPTRRPRSEPGDPAWSHSWLQSEIISTNSSASPRPLFHSSA